MKAFALVMPMILVASACNSGQPRIQSRRVFIQPQAQNQVLSIAKRYLGTPYLYGGANPSSGFDCSGLVGYVYRKAGYELPRDTRNQYSVTRPVKVPRPGDLIFFRLKGRVGHVGIYAGNLKFIHAPSTGKKVSYADLRNSYWKSRYAGSRTIFW